MTAGRKNHESLSHHWCTPQQYVEAVQECFGGRIDLDPCSNRHSVVHAQIEYCLPDRDGLAESWDYPTIYVNPPYGRDKIRGTSIRDWLAKCRRANAKHGSEVLALVPVATNTRHWKESVFGAATAICFLYDTRLRFLVNGRNISKGAPMACAMVYWGAHFDQFQDIFLRFGAVVPLGHLEGQLIGYGADSWMKERQALLRQNELWPD